MTTLPHHHKKIIGLYALVSCGAIMMMIPFSIIPLASIACITVAFFGCYIYRWLNKKDDFTRFHTGYLIRTLWWSLLILLVGIILFGLIVYNNGDLSAINKMMSSAEKGLVLTNNDIALMQLQFVMANKSLILITAIFCLCPYPIYLLYRSYKGVQIASQQN